MDEQWKRAGLLITAPGGKYINLLRYAAWLIRERHTTLKQNWSLTLREWLSVAKADRKTALKHLQQLGLGHVCTIDLRILIPNLHTWMAARNRETTRSSARTPALERFRAERARLARLERLEREGKLLPQAELRAGLMHISQVLRASAERLEDLYGRDAGDIIREVLTRLSDDFAQDTSTFNS